MEVTLFSLSSLFYPASNGWKQVVSNLIAHGASEHERYKGGSTPLHSAASANKGSSQVIQFLLRVCCEFSLCDAISVTRSK
jgi:ankyrin repeat protein